MAESKLKTSDLFDQFAEDLLKERNVRPLIIIGAAKIDDLLFEIIGAFLLPKRAKLKEQDELLEGDNPLGTFSARIKTCHRLGLIDDEFCQALERLRTIRNKSAHSIDFDHRKSPVRDHLNEFKKIIVDRRSYQLTQERYFDLTSLGAIEEIQCLVLTMCVLLEAVKKKVGRTSGHKRALMISSK